MDKGLRSVIQLGVAFMLFLGAAMTMNNIQKTITSSIHKDDPSFQADGYYGQSIVYTCFAVFNWAAPSLIALIGPIFSMCLGAILTIAFILQFLIPKTWSLYLLSGAMGLGYATVWTAEGNYLTLNSTPETITRNSGIFSTLASSNLIIGNLAIMFAFYGKEEIDRSTRMYVILTLAAISGAGLLAFLLLPKIENKKTEVIKTEGPVQAFLGAVKLYFTKNMLLLTFSFIYFGLELSFYSGIYSSCLGFTKQFDNRKQLVGISGIFVGIGDVLCCGTIAIFGHKIVRKSHIVIIGCVVHVLAFCLIFLNLPNDSPFSDTDQKAFIESNAILAIFCSFLLGVGDSIFNNMITSLIATMYPDNSSAAFAIFQFFVGIGSVISFITAQSLGLYYQLSILLVVVMIATLCFITVELSKKRNSILPIKKELHLEKF